MRSLTQWVLTTFASPVGILVLDLAVQLSHVSNQNVVYRLRPEARSRLNAGYMTGYFLGGSLGSLLSARLYEHFGWTGVSLAGCLLAATALAVWGLFLLRQRQARA